MQHSKSLYERGVLKNLKMLTQTQYSNFKFSGRLDNIKTFYAGVKALNFGEHGLFQISDDGFRLTTENGKSIQGSLFLTTACFSEFHVDGIVNFGLNMNVFIDCLGVFSGIDCSMSLLYKGDSTPLTIILNPHDDENMTTECAIKTINFEEPMDFSLDADSASLNTILIRSEEMMNICNEIDKTAAELAITLSPRSPYFKIESLGVIQSETSVQISKTSDMIVLFNCREKTTARYKNSQFRTIMKALTVANKVAIKTDLSGLLEMQFMLQNEETSEIYIQCFLTPVVELD